MAKIAFELGHNPDYLVLNLARWAHDLGHRGHFLTKSRRFSVTFAYLRSLRAAWREAQRQQGGQAPDNQFQFANRLYFVGQGWPFACDAYLVAPWRDETEEAREYAKELLEEQLSQGGDS